MLACYLFYFLSRQTCYGKSSFKKMKGT